MLSLVMRKIFHSQEIKGQKIFPSILFQSFWLGVSSILSRVRNTRGMTQGNVRRDVLL